MAWKKRVAKEWIWFICTFVCGMGLSFLLNYIYWEGLRSWIAIFIVWILIMAIIYAIRLTDWAIKQVKREDGE